MFFINGSWNKGAVVRMLRNDHVFPRGIRLRNKQFISRAPDMAGDKECCLMPNMISMGAQKCKVYPLVA